MSKLFLFMMTSLDGYFEGPNHDISWHHVDADFNEFAIEQTKNVGTLLFGRRTYELMASYWPSEHARTTDPVVAELMNNTPKIVFSKTLKSADWGNTTLVRENVKEEIQKLKQTSTKDVAVYGSSNLCISLLQWGLLDELRIMVNPVIIGNGTPLFHGLNRSHNVQLLSTKTFNSGNVLLTYTT